MKIYLDTNIFYKNWFLESAHFKYLFTFINNEAHDLVISKLVIEEIENIRNREINLTIEKINREFDYLNKRLNKCLNLDIHSMVNEQYSIESLLKNSVEWLQIIDYNDVPPEFITFQNTISRIPYLWYL
jgi:predicted nucleic acid-binding protein